MKTNDLLYSNIDHVSDQLFFSNEITSEKLYRDYWKICAAIGMLGIPISCEYGGLGYDAVNSAHAMMHFGKRTKNSGLIFAIGAHQFACAVPIFLHANDLVKKELLPRLCDGSLIGANAMTEGKSGSDINAIESIAVQEGDHYLISGEKFYITNAPFADVFILFARTNPEAGMFGISAFVVKKDTPGFEMVDEFAPKGMQPIGISKIKLTDCKVHSAYLLGNEGDGLSIFHDAMYWERTCLFSGFLGLIESGLDLLIDFSKNRKHKNKSISQNQAVSHRLAAIKLQLASSQLLMQKACELQDDAEKGRLYSVLAKLSVSETYLNFAINASQIYSGIGADNEHYSAHYLNDAILSTLFSGTSDMMKNIIAHELLK